MSFDSTSSQHDSSRSLLWNRLRRSRSSDESSDARDRDLITPTPLSQSPPTELPYDPSFHHVYRPLPNHSTIRLLELLPGELEDRVQCRLHFGYIPEKLPYEAVSYVWGNHNDVKLLLCEGRLLAVPQSLYNALRRFRHSDTSRWLWADAACIDQGDMVERGHQVTHMGEIFKRATNVIIWLGEDDEGDAEIVFPWISDFAQQATGDRDFDAATALPLVNADIWRRLANILRRPYWRRLWTFQEICLATEAIMYCGEMQVPYADLEVLLGVLVRKGYSITKQYQIPASFVRGRLGEYINPSRSVYRKFFNTLCKGRAFLCSDNRDKVYGLLGLFQNHTIPEYEILMRADYSKTMEDVYYEVALLLSRGSTPLLFLSGVMHERLPVNYASWVPMWNLRRRVAELAGWKGTYFRASSDALPEFRVSKDGSRRLLAAKGVLVGEINWHPYFIGRTGLDVSSEVNGELPDGSSPLIRLWKEFCKRVQRYPSSTSRVRAFYQTITADSLPSRARDSFSSVEEALGDFIKYLELAQENGALLDTATIEAAKHMLQLDTPIEDDFSYYSSHQFLLCVSRICMGRTFFTMRSGYCGLGHAILQPGDLVAVLYGSEVPVVLRSYGDTYQVVGDCFVEGIMKGEAVDMVRNGDLMEEYIVLC